ncbi:MAG: alpha/beta hydrolase, partial [Smithella sp.]
MNTLLRLLTLVMTLVLLSGCALFNLNRDNTFSKDSCLITGNVFFWGIEPVKKQIRVIAYAEVDGKFKVAHYAVLHAPGSFELLVPQGKYRLLAFEDANQNLILDQNEAASIPMDGTMSKEVQINAPGGGLVSDITFMLSTMQAISHKVPADVLEKIKKVKSTVPDDVLARNITGNFNWQSNQAGAIMDINAPAYSAEEGANGFWLPYEFFKKHGANVYFLEPYDAKRTPVLLVHGAAGSPQDWRYFIDKIDRTRYQIWIYYYPSGARLKTMAELLSNKVSELHKQYHFEKLYITAHSMGGLVARHALASNADHRFYSKLFISISSPFGGEKMAETGVEKSPAVIPSWKDMTPDSEFIKKMFATKIPSTTKNYLFFGHKGNRNPLRGNNDSTVTLESMLDPRAQKEALKVFAFNEDHVSILNSPDVFDQYNQILNNTDREEDAIAGSQKKGFFRLQYIVKQQSNVPPLFMWLFFHPSEKGKPAFFIPVNPKNMDRDIQLAEG